MGAAPPLPPHHPTITHYSCYKKPLQLTTMTYPAKPDTDVIDNDDDDTDKDENDDNDYTAEYQRGRRQR